MKRKKVGYGNIVVFVIFCLFLFGAVTRQKRASSLVLGDHSEKTRSSRNGDDNDHVNSDEPSFQLVPSTVPTVIPPTQGVTPIVVVDPTVTAIPTISSAPTESKEDKQQDQNNTPLNSYTNNPIIYKDLVTVPVSQKSVVESIVYVPETTKPKSIIKTIQTKFEQVGGGQFLTQPKINSMPKPTPTLNLNKTKEEVDTLAGDVSVFYRFQNGNVVLGAESNTGNSLKIPEGDLRRAEISMGTALQKEGLSLGVSGEEKFVLKDKTYLVLSSMPVLVDIDDRKIYLETGSGKQELSTLPDEAVDTAIEFKAFDKLSNEKPPVLGVVGGELGYDVLGEKTYKLFGKVPVKAKVHVYVMVGSNEVVEGDQSFLTKLIKIASL